MLPRKRKHEDLVGEHEKFLTNLLEIARNGGNVVKEVLRFQTGHKTDAQTMAATDFTLEGAVAAFGLRYSSAVSLSEPRMWKIQDIPETKGFELTPCLKSVIENYSRNFDRSSEATCRTAVDFILNECLTVMKCNQTTVQPSPRTPPFPQDIKFLGKVSISHTITPVEKSRLASLYSGVVVNGRVDYVIGRVSMSPLKRHFQSFLLLVVAKTAYNLEKVFSQLIVYLASLHQFRLSRNRSDTSVYGVATDGYLFIFVTITHDGALKRSKMFDIAGGDLTTVLGCLKYLLGKTASLTPNLTPERNSGHPPNVDGGEDPAIDLDDNDYTNPPLDNEE